MNKFYDENIGSEPILPNEIIELLNLCKTSNKKQRRHYKLMANKITSLLDEHELAMAE